jgi:hypothetical protein
MTTEYQPIVPSAQYLDESKLPLPPHDLDTQVSKIKSCAVDAEKLLRLIREAEAEGRDTVPGFIETSSLDKIKQRFAGKVMDLYLRERYVRLHHQKAGA